MHTDSLLGRAAAILVVSLAFTAPARAQSEEDFVAYLALLTTPKGALSPLAPTSAHSVVTVRYGRNGVFDSDSDDDGAFNNFGLTFSPRVAAGRFDFTVGAITCRGCDGSILAEIGYGATIHTTRMGGETSLTFGISPAFGYGRSTGDSELNSMSLTGELPVALIVPAGASGRLTLFVTPGYGWGRISDEGDSLDGSRPLLSGGAQLSSATGFGVTLGIQKIFLDEGKSTLGLGVSLPIGGR